MSACIAKKGAKFDHVVVFDSNDFLVSDGDFGKYFHLPVSVNFGKWILYTGKLPVNKKNPLTP
jgi:hypothetical protein